MTKTEQFRVDRFMPGGVPRWVRVYDNGGESADRFTCIFSGASATLRSPGNTPEYQYLAMSGSPFHPQGVGMHGGTKNQPADTMRNKPGYRWPPAVGRKCHLGVRITFTELNAECQLCVMQDYQEIWKLPKEVLLPFQAAYRKLFTPPSLSEV